jgi:hypothetical protein
MLKRSESPSNNGQMTPLSRNRPSTMTTTTVTPVSTKTPNNLKSPIPVSPSTNNSFNSYSYRTESESPEPRSSSSSDETDNVNGNFPPKLPTSPPPPPSNVENLNERNKKFDIRRNSNTDKSVVEQHHSSESIDPVLISSSSDELDNVRSLSSSTHNLNFKLGSTATTTTLNNSVGVGGRQGRSTYWTSQALQNDNAQKISEVMPVRVNDFTMNKIHEKTEKSS